jgi:hypothetical protein
MTIVVKKLSKIFNQYLSKAKIKKIWQNTYKPLWIFFIGFIIIFTVYILYLEKKYESENVAKFVKINEKFISCKKAECKPGKNNILSLYLNKLINKQGETYVSGKFAISVYDPKRKLKQLNIRLNFPETRYKSTILKINTNQHHSQYGNFSFGSTREFNYIPIKGKHWLYPLDDLSFSQSIEIPNKVDFNMVDIYNRTLGFILPDNIIISQSGDQILTNFDLDRKNSIKIAFGLFFVFITLYILFILIWVKTVSTVATTVGGFFFSIWSIRSILGIEAHTFPTLLDLFAIYSGIILLIGILTKIVFGRYLSEEQNNRTPRNRKSKKVDESQL